MKNEYKITKELMMSWAKEYYLPNTASIVLFALWMSVGVFGLFLLGLCIMGVGDFLNWFISVWFIAISAFKLYFQRFLIISKRYELFSKTYAVPEWIRTTEFTDDEIILSDHTSVTKLKYHNIKKIKEKSNLVMVFFNDNLALRIYKDAFTQGSWEECKTFINSKINNK